MDIRHFEALQRMISAGHPRRRLLGLLAMLPLVGGIVGGLAQDEAEGHGRRKRRKKRHKHGKSRRRTHRKRRQPGKGCDGCYDSSGVCQPGTTTAACGSSGACEGCTGQEQCQGQACVCVPDCAGKCSGAADGCGGTCTGGCAGGRVCLGNGTCALPCPGGGPDCTAAGCAAIRCIGTSQGNVCSLGDGEDGCSGGDNAQCPFGRACSGVLCEAVC